MYYKILQPCSGDYPEVPASQMSGTYQSAYGGRHTWEPGVTYGPVPVDPCRSGFHACRLQDLTIWAEPGMVVFEVELTDVVETTDKVVGSTAKLGRCLGHITRDTFDRLYRDYEDPFGWQTFTGSMNPGGVVAAREARGRLLLSLLVTP